MKKIYFKNSISFLIITSILVMPFYILPKKAEAQNLLTQGDGYGLQDSIQNVMPIINQMFLCKGKTQKIFTDGAVDEEWLAQIDKDFGLNDISDGAQNQTTSVPTYDANANKKLDEQAKEIKEIKKEQKDLTANDTCWKSIGKLVVKILIQELTASIVTWIQGGYDGNEPAFMQDPQRYFRELARNEILGFGQEINNPQLFPFGQAFMINTANNYNKKFQDNARYSLNELMNNSDTTLVDGTFTIQNYANDFRNGGWTAWNYMTQVPANNALGFNLIASKELSKRLEGTKQSPAQDIRDAMSYGQGFLGDQRCTDPQNLSREEDRKGRAERASDPDGPYQHNICEGAWEYVTPGKMIADISTKAINLPADSLLDVEDLNGALAALTDAFTAKFFNNTFAGGLVALSNSSTDPLLIDPSIYGNANNIPGLQQTAIDFPSYQIDSSNWLSANPNFNIRDGIPQSLIDDQRIFIEKLENQNKELSSKVAVTTENPKGNYGLIPTIYQLDYCIPGPHPGWESDIQTTFDKAKEGILDASNMTDDNIDQFVTAWSYFDPAGIFSFITGPIAESELAGARFEYYARAFYAITGINASNLNDVSEQAQFGSRSLVMSYLEVVFKKYKQIMKDMYRIDRLPQVAGEASNEFKKIPGYKQMIEDNTERILLLKGIVSRLDEIKTSVQNLNNQLTNGTISESDYETALKPLIISFGRLSKDMISPEDIAVADSLLNQIKEKTTYIYKNLLKGPFGCEKDWQEKRIILPWQIYAEKTVNYPKENPIFYDYNLMSANQEIPDPFNSGFSPKNRITDMRQFSDNHPGFLGFVTVETAWNENSQNQPNMVGKTFGDIDTENYCYYVQNPADWNFTKRLSSMGSDNTWRTVCGLDLNPINPFIEDPDYTPIYFKANNGGDGFVLPKFEKTLEIW